MRIFTAALFIMLSSQAFSMALLDPNNKAAVLQRFFNITTNEPFACNVPVKFTQTLSRCEYVCDPQLCRELCAPALNPTFEVQAENCSAEHVEIISSISWTATSRQLTDYKYGQTWLEDFIQSIDFFIVPSGVFEIDHIFEFTPRTLVDEFGDEHNIDAMTVLLTYKQPHSLDGLSFELVLDKNARGIEQILSFGPAQDDGYLLKRWGLLK